MKNEMRGESFPGGPLGEEYRLWSFVTDGFVIRARCQSAFLYTSVYVPRVGMGTGFIVFFSQLSLISTANTELHIITFERQ